MESKVVWNKQLSFTGTAESGLSVPIDASGFTESEGGFRPMELFAIGLAGCTALDVISIMSKKRQDVTAFEVQTHIDRAETHPKVFTHAVIEYFVTGHHLDEAAVVRSIELSATAYCPAQAMLNRVMPIELVYHIYEDEGDGKRSLLKSGQYRPIS